MRAVGDVRQPDRESEKFRFSPKPLPVLFVKGVCLLNCSTVEFNVKSTATVCFQASVGYSKMFNLPIFAYLDPGAGSLLLQALVGGFAGLFVMGRHFFRMLRTLRTSQQQADGSQVAAEHA